MARDREQYFMYDCAALGLKKTDPGQLLFHVGNYLMAQTQVTSFLKPDQRNAYLDVGCGSGYGTEIMGAMFERSRGIDADELAVAYGNEMHTRAGTVFTTWLGIGQYVSGIKFDFVTMLESIEHFSEDSVGMVLHNVAAWMQPHGALWICTPIATTKDGKNHDNHYHAHEYHPGELKGLLGGFFEDVQIAATGFRMFALAKKPKQ